MPKLAEKRTVKRAVAKKKLRKVYKHGTKLENKIYKKHGDDETKYNASVRRFHEWLKVTGTKAKPSKIFSWTDDDWRIAHPPAGKRWTAWQLEMMPKSIQPIKESMIQCIACGKHAVTFYLKQCRSADEAATRFNECTACGKKWKCDG